MNMKFFKRTGVYDVNINFRIVEQDGRQFLVFQKKIVSPPIIKNILEDAIQNKKIVFNIIYNKQNIDEIIKKLKV